MKSNLSLEMKGIGLLLLLLAILVFGSIDRSPPDLAKHLRLATPPKPVPEDQNGIYWLLQAVPKWREAKDHDAMYKAQALIRGEPSLLEPRLSEAEAYSIAADWLTDNQAAIADLDRALACNDWIWPDRARDCLDADPMALVNLQLARLQSFSKCSTALALQAASRRYAGDLDGAIAAIAKGCQFYNLGMQDCHSDYITFLVYCSGLGGRSQFIEALIQDPRLNEKQLAELLGILNRVEDPLLGLKNHFSQDLALQPLFCSRKTLRGWISASPDNPIESRALAKFLATSPYHYHPNRLVATRLRACEETMALIGKSDAAITSWEGQQIIHGTWVAKHPILIYPLLLLPNSAKWALENEAFLFSPEYLHYCYAKGIHKAIEYETLLQGLRLQAACRLYEIRHGQLPESLDLLVPDYLPAVPKDPYDGAPFRYDPAQRLLYSVGANHQDDHGVSPRLPAAEGRRRAFHQLRSENHDSDVVFPIKGPKEVPVKVRDTY